VQALGCMLYKMMYYADPFDGKLGILNARYRAPDFPPYTPKMHDLLSTVLSLSRVCGVCVGSCQHAHLGVSTDIRCTEFLLMADPEKRPDICDVLEKLGTSVPRIKRKAAPVKGAFSPSSSAPLAPSPDAQPADDHARLLLATERSASPRRENGNADDAAGKDLFAMLDWQKNDGPSSPATAVQRSGAREARSRSPAAESLVDDFEKKATISNGNDQATDFFAAFDVQRQPSPSPSTPAASGGAAAIDFFSSPSSTSSAAGNDDAWGEFSTFATASAPAPAAGAAPLGVALMGSPLASPTTAHRQPVEKKDILSLYATDPASGAASPASASLYGHPGYAPSPPMSGTYNTMPVGMPMGMVYVMAQPTAVASPMASPLYARAPSPLAGGSTLAPGPYGSGAAVSPLVAHRAPLSGGLTPMSTPPLTPLSTPPLTPMSGRSGPGAMPAAAGGPGAAGDPFADLWKTASK
jgi:hypothetical protein